MGAMVKPRLAVMDARKQKQKLKPTHKISDKCSESLNSVTSGDRCESHQKF